MSDISLNENGSGNKTNAEFLNNVKNGGQSKNKIAPQCNSNEPPSTRFLLGSNGSGKSFDGPWVVRKEQVYEKNTLFFNTTPSNACAAECYSMKQLQVLHI